MFYTQKLRGDMIMAMVLVSFLCNVPDGQDFVETYHPLVTDAKVKLQTLNGQETELEAEDYSITAVDQEDEE